MKSTKHGSALIAGIAALALSQSIEVGVAYAACPITDFSPKGIESALKANGIDTAAKFVACLPLEYRENWIMMSLSQSSQSGTAEYPRFILTSKDSTKVFGFELPTNPAAVAFNTIEYFQFVEGTANKFHFHSIITNTLTVITDNKDCLSCHFRDPRPNWDAYDSWGGMLPFNRDRVYQFATIAGKDEESVEAKAIKRIFKALKVKGDALFTQLKLPNGISQNNATGDVTIKYTAPCDNACFNDPGAGGGLVPVKYGLDKDGNVVYPGDTGTTNVKQGGNFLRLNSPSKPAASDEGRGVALFDNFTIDLTTRMPGPNPKRIAQSILDYVKDPAVVDVRYVAFAIAKQALGVFTDCITADTLGKFAPKEDLDKLLALQTTIDGKAVPDFPSLVADTDTRRKRLPQLKANLESQNLEALIKANGDAFTANRLNANIARRSTNGAPLAVTYETDSIPGMGWMIDRELYGNGDTPPPEGGNQNTTIALFRLYLAPLPQNDKKVSLPVSQWSMSVRTTEDIGPKGGVNRRRNQTYTFGDLLSRYTMQLQSTLKDALGDLSCSDLAAGSIKAFNSATNKE
jgi:hypothetical protein